MSNRVESVQGQNPDGERYQTINDISLLRFNRNSQGVKGEKFMFEGPASSFIPRV